MLNELAAAGNCRPVGCEHCRRRKRRLYSSVCQDNRGFGQRPDIRKINAK